jgi:hypothetical protein
MKHRFFCNAALRLFLWLGINCQKELCSVFQLVLFKRFSAILRGFHFFKNRLVKIQHHNYFEHFSKNDWIFDLGKTVTFKNTILTTLLNVPMVFLLMISKTPKPQGAGSVRGRKNRLRSG